MLLFLELVVEKPKSEKLMGIKKPINIWRPHNGLKFKSNHASNFWLDSLF
jgi:hypothetical protein